MYNQRISLMYFAQTHIKYEIGTETKECDNFDMLRVRSHYTTIISHRLEWGNLFVSYLSNEYETRISCDFRRENVVKCMPL